MKPISQTVPRATASIQLLVSPRSFSVGNFLTLQEAVVEYGADAVRMALADAGDSIDDANFVKSVANSAILRLTKELGWVKEVLEALPTMRRGQRFFADRAFANEINHAVHLTKEVPPLQFS